MNQRNDILNGGGLKDDEVAAIQRMLAICTNPALTKKRKKKKRRVNWVITPDKFFRADEIGRMRDYLSGKYRNEARRAFINLFLVELLLGTGLRASELCDLRVDQTPIVLGVNQIWVVGKGNKKRVITITPALSAMIADYVENVRPGLLPRRIKKKDFSKRLLFSEYQTPMNRKALYKRLRNIGINAGILKKVGTHKFRHTYATSFYRCQPDLLVLQNLLGHSSPNTTAIYAKIDTGSIGQMLEKVDILNVQTTLSPKKKNKPRNNKKL